MKTCVVRKRIPPYSGSVPVNIADTIYTPPGFGTPKFAICFYTNGNDNDVFDESSTNRVYGIGYIGLSALDNSTLIALTSVLGLQHNESSSTATNKSVSGNYYGRFVSEIRVSDRSVFRQFTAPVFGQDKLDYNLSHVNTSSNNLDLIFAFFTGDDVQANIGTTNLSITRGAAVSVTGMAFAPDLVFISGTGYSYNANGLDGRLSFGCSTKFGTIKNSCTAFRMRNTAAAVTTVSEYISDTRCFSMFALNSGIASTAEVTSFNNDGFTLTSREAFTFSTTTSTSQILFMAIKGPLSNIFNLQNYSSSTSTGISGIATTDYIPSLILGALGSAISTNTITTSNDSTGFSAFAVKALNSKSNYGLGSMSVSNGASAVTGSGTAFSSLNPGDIIYNSTNTQIGTVSSVSNNTSLTLTSGASAAMSSENYSIIPFGQFSVSIGASNSAATTKVYSAINTNPFFVASYGTSATPTTLVKAKVNNFDSYPGFKINYDTVNATARKGWFVAFKDNENRRRDAN